MTLTNFKTFIFPQKHSLSLFHVNACSLRKNFDDLERVLKFFNKVFDIDVVSETKITKNLH